MSSATQEMPVTQCYEINEDELTELSDGVNPDLWGRFIPMHLNCGKCDFTKPDYTFGRAKVCDFSYGHLPDAGHMSGKHCTVKIERDSFGRATVTVHDSSSNGTFVNQQRMTKGTRTSLQHGDVVSFIVPYDAQNEECEKCNPTVLSATSSIIRNLLLSF